jgi:hypothetical protein
LKEGAILSTESTLTTYTKRKSEAISASRRTAAREKKALYRRLLASRHSAYRKQPSDLH